MQLLFYLLFVQNFKGESYSVLPPWFVISKDCLFMYTKTFVYSFKIFSLKIMAAGSRQVPKRNLPKIPLIF